MGKRGGHRSGPRNQYGLICPFCGANFLRRFNTLHRTTSCPSCAQRFSRLDAICEETKRQLLRERAQKKIDYIRGFYPKLPSGVIRGDQIPTSIAEARFKAHAAQKGWRPHRPSWPDFLVETDFGLIAVEVKDQDSISREQAQTMSLLEEAGLPTYVWRRGANFLRRWKRRTYAVEDLELPEPRPRKRTARRHGDPGEDPKGAGDSSNDAIPQDEQYPGKSTRSVSAGSTSDIAKRTTALHQAIDLIANR